MELNALLRSNQDIVERARTQVGNLAHALKTPLAVITNEAREDKSQLGRKVAEQTEIMRDQVSHYLDRARMAAPGNVIGRSTEVLTVAEPLIRALERIHRDNAVAITTQCPPGLRFHGEKQDLEEMLGNLLDNACKWARASVHLTVSRKLRQTRTSPALITLLVEDDGPGLTDEQRKRIGKRGQRLDETKPGSGLGLSIVTDLVHLYHGEFELGQSPYGGLSVRLDLPGV
jgi:signal transduction histidine kinase